MQANQFTVRVTKLEAARRQLETAIDLYFRDGDPVSIHTLCCSAYDVIHVLNKKRNDPLDLNDMMLKDLDRLLGSNALKKVFHDYLNAAQNFFKHGNSDANSAETLDTRYTEYLLYEAVQKYSRLVGECPPAMVLYIVWFASRHPDVLEGIEIPDPQRDMFERFCRNASTDRVTFYAKFFPVTKALSI